MQRSPSRQESTSMVNLRKDNENGWGMCSDVQNARKRRRGELNNSLNEQVFANAQSLIMKMKNNYIIYAR